MNHKKSYIIFISILTFILILAMSIYTKAETESTSNSDKEVKITKDADIKILPLLGSNKIGKVNKDQKVEILSSTNLWAFIQTDELTGWVPLSSVGEKKSTENESNNTVQTNEVENETSNIIANEANTTVANNVDNNTQTKNNTEKVENTSKSTETTSNTKELKPTTKYIKTTSAYIREKASTDSKILGTLIKDTDVKVTAEVDGWYKIKYEDIIGFIKKDLIVDQQSNPNK